jgi:putative colanic acid biosynthesis UDP-glucose lipid carrier transferase
MDVTPPETLIRSQRYFAGSELRGTRQVLDLLVLALAALVAYWLRFRTLQIPVTYLRATLVIVLLAAVALPLANAYEDWRNLGRYAELKRVSAAWSLAFAAYAALALMLKFSDDYSRLWTGLTFGVGEAGLLGVRLGLRRYLQYRALRQRNRHSAVVVGGNSTLTQRVLHHLESHTAGIDVVGYFSPRQEGAQTPYLGSLDKVSEFLAARPVHQVWLAMPLAADKDLAPILSALRDSPADIRLVPDTFSAWLLNAPRREIAGLSAIDLRSCPLDGPGYSLKTIEDYLLAGIFLVLASPLLALLAVGVKLSSPGPVLFKQLRHGRDGEIIEVWKFRTMHPHREAPGQLTQARRSDPRFTRFGAFLRRTSLDELPQLFNVLQGRMSLVGPRPHAVEHNRLYADIVQNYPHRHRAKPGITGWAQVHGLRGETDTVEKMAARVRFDLYYIQNWSLLLDLRILAMTLKTLLLAKNAY